MIEKIREEMLKKYRVSSKVPEYIVNLVIQKTKKSEHEKRVFQVFCRLGYHIWCDYSNPGWLTLRRKCCICGKVETKTNAVRNGRVVEGVWK